MNLEIYLANYKRPRYYSFVQEIPELSEKVKDRNILKQMAKEDMENGLLIRLFTDKDALRLRITIGPKDIMERVIYQLKRALR